MEPSSLDRANPDDASTYLDWKELELEHCTSLHSVSILYANSGPFYTFGTILDILPVIPITVKEITLVIRKAQWFDTVDWPRLEKELKRFTSLQSVQFHECTADTFRSRPVDQATRKRIWNALPEIEARGILW